MKSLGSHVAAVSGRCQKGQGQWQLHMTLTSHVGKLLAAALEVVTVLGLDGVLDGAGHGVVGTEDGALDELDLSRHAALEAASGCHGATRLLTLAPCLGGACLAALVGRGGALGGAILGGGVVAARDGVVLGAVVGLAGILRGPLRRIRLGQAVGGVGADLGVAVEGVWVGAAGCILVLQQRAGDLVLIMPTVGVVLRVGSVAGRRGEATNWGSVRPYGVLRIGCCTP